MPSPILKFNKLFHVYNTTLRMLQDRGCTIISPAPVVEALRANPTGATPVSLALLKSICRPDDEDAQHGLLINRAALTITSTLSAYVLQLIGASSNDAQPLMQTVFVEEESMNLSMHTVLRCRESARTAGAQYLVIVADGKVNSLLSKECDELNIGWTLLTTSAAATAAQKNQSGALTSSTGGNGVVSDIVERTVVGMDIPAGAKPRRMIKKNSAAATEESAVAIQSAFVDENQKIASLVTLNGTDDDTTNKTAVNATSAAAKPRPLFVELFEEDELVFSPLRHSMAPKHRVLSEVETEALLREKGATLSQLPRMEFADPISRYYGLQRGAVVHITRAAHTDVVGEHSMYRHVV